MRGSVKAQARIDCQDDVCDLEQIYLEVRGRFTTATRCTWISCDVDGVGAVGMISVDLIWGGGMWRNVYNSAVLLLLRDIVDGRTDGGCHDCD